jgi:hypothetical protein
MREAVEQVPEITYHTDHVPEFQDRRRYETYDEVRPQKTYETKDDVSTTTHTEPAPQYERCIVYEAVQDNPLTRMQEPGFTETVERHNWVDGNAPVTQRPIYTLPENERYWRNHWREAPSVEPVWREPVVVEPVWSTPVITEPVWREPAWREPVLVEPAWREPVWSEPAWREPAWREPVIIEPAWREPVFVAPAVVAPAVILPAAETSK